MQTKAETTERVAKRAHEACSEAEREMKEAKGAVERFVHEQPLTSAALAFAAGVVTMALLRR